MLMTTTPPASARGPGPERSRADRDLFVRYHEQRDLQARDQLVERFLPLARQLARRYQRAERAARRPAAGRLARADQGVDRFDPEREIAFSTYAVPTILGEIKRYFRDRTWAVRVPRDLQELALRSTVPSASSPRSCTASRRSRRSPPSSASTRRRCSRRCEAGGAYRAISFDAPRAGGEEDVGDDRRLGRRRGGRLRPRRGARDAETLLTTVTPRERDVLRMRFEQDMTQAEIGAVIGVSQMQVSRIIRQAITRLRAAADAPRAQPDRADRDGRPAGG